MIPAITVGCVDVGSIRNGKLGWSVIESGKARWGTQPADLVREAVQALRNGKLALGFECPLYVPLRQDPLELTRCRRGERYVNWCGGPGSSVLATGLVQVRWILTRIADAVPGIRGTTRWNEFVGGQCELLVWEAFITSKDGRRPVLTKYGARKTGAHEHDALSGAATFVERLEGGAPIVSELETEPSMSLVAWHLLSTSLSDDVSLQSESCLVVKTRKRRASRKQRVRGERRRRLRRAA